MVGVGVGWMLAKERRQNLKSELNLLFVVVLFAEAKLQRGR